MRCLGLSKKLMITLCMGLAALPGCTSQKFNFAAKPSASYYQSFATRTEYPDVNSHLDPQVAGVHVPHAFENPSELPTWELSLPEVIQLAMTNSTILRSTGASVVQAPNAMNTTYNPAIVESNPQAGVEAALSAFDAQMSTQLFWQKNNRPNNNIFFFVPTVFAETSGNFALELSKRSATGARFALRHNVVYSNPNTPGRLFQSDFTGWFEMEWRQPLMQGSGITYNQIAGPNSGIGQYNGVLLARINTDIALHDFENSVIQLVNDVEGAYWDLYFAFRNLEAQVSARESLLKTWQLTKAKADVGLRGGEKDAEAQARAQFFTFDASVQNAQAGPNGIYSAEQRLRYLLGLPAGDGRLIKPTSRPIQAQIVYDWNSAIGDALTQRVEVRRQKWSIKRRELELIAARQNRRPRLDALTQYRWRGLGDHLIGSENPNFEFESLYQNITAGQYQEWQAGLELSYPVGFRQASVAVRNAQWNLVREQALLKEQELRISHDLSTSAREIARNYEIARTNINRVFANEEKVQVLTERFEAGTININILLLAQQDLVASQTDFYRSLIDYNLAVRNFHREKGSLLAYNQISLAESAWPNGAYNDAYERGQWFQPRKQPEKTTQLQPVSNGAYDPSQIGATPFELPATNGGTNDAAPEQNTPAG
jgi:outer membrane protein TolC